MNHNANTNEDLLDQIDRHLASPKLSWLLGAGISFNAGIPLMYPLTMRVKNLLEGSTNKELLQSLWNALPEDAHIEYLLSNIGDYTALAERSRNGSINVDGKNYTASNLADTHTEVVSRIAETIRWGYEQRTDDKPERIGTQGSPITKIDEHRAFVSSLFRTAHAGLQERRGPVRIFSTNYDTLMEDALSLEEIPHWDGFSGGAVAFRSHCFGQDEPCSEYRAHLVKLHGSIDWHLDEGGRVWRVREWDNYPETKQRVMIYPQATKYLATQRDPFAAQFELLRRALASASDNVFAICGYSFGDEHINQEIEHAMSHPNSRTTLIAFSREINDCLEEWRKRPWGKRVYVATEKGLFVGQEGPYHEPVEGGSRDWWLFSGMTKLLRDGAGSAS